jgi:ketosteroid isomerase-like protein
MSARYDYPSLIDYYFRAVVDGRVDDILSCFCEDGSFHPPFADRPFTGYDELRAFFESLLTRFVDRSEDTTRVVVDGDRAFSELVLEGDAPDGRHVRFENCNVYRFRDGRFAAIRVYGDAATMRRQIGV